MSNKYYYKGANPTVDLIIVNPEGEILLIKRSDTAEACPDMWAIPGGFINTDAKKENILKKVRKHLNKLLSVNYKKKLIYI
jgi:ADP-ribose pyrophosphatase YjhB (NUDIX family)